MKRHGHNLLLCLHAQIRTHHHHLWLLLHAFFSSSPSHLLYPTSPCCFFTEGLATGSPLFLHHPSSSAAAGGGHSFARPHWSDSQLARSRSVGVQPKSQPLLSHRGHGKAQSGAGRSRSRWRGWEKLTGSLRVLRFLVKCRRFLRSRWKVGARSFMRTVGLMPRLPTSLTGGRRSPKGGPVSSGEPQAGLKSGRLRGTSEDQKISVCVCAGASAGNSSSQPQTQPICTDTNPVTTQSMEDDEEGEREREGVRERTKRWVSVRGITCMLLETSALKCQLLIM